MPIYWMRRNDAFPGSLPDDDAFCAFDNEVRFERIQSRPDAEYIGGVNLIRGGMKDGLWQWSMTVSLPGPAFGRPTNGTSAQRAEAAHAMLDCYTLYLKTRPVDYTR